MAPPEQPETDAPRLAGEVVALVGKLTGMTHPEARALIRDHGATVHDSDGGSATLVVLGDNQPDLASALQPDNGAHQRLADDVAAGRAEVVREAQLWQRLGLIDDDMDGADNEGCNNAKHETVQRLYTPAMLAELLGVPAAAIRRWHRRGALVACRNVRRLPYFDFAEVAVSRHLATLHKAGCSLDTIDRKLAQLGRAMPDAPRPLCEPSLVVSGQQFILRRGDDLAEPSGQLLIDFDNTDSSAGGDCGDDAEEVVLSVVGGWPPDSSKGSAALSTFEQLHFEALKWEDQGELALAAETYRTLLMAAGPTAETHFALGDVLYRLGELPAARERFYAAIELDEQYVEARANLGCVLAENGELELAVAAFEGALALHSDYADVHYHLAGALDRQERNDEAESHWQTFLTLAPESPWAASARERLGQSPADLLTT